MTDEETFKHALKQKWFLFVQATPLWEMLPEILIRLTLLLMTISITFFKLLSKFYKIQIYCTNSIFAANHSFHLPELRGLRRNRKSADFYRFWGLAFVLSKWSVEFGALSRMSAAFELLMAYKLKIESTFADC